jgi:hypothetical protein
MMDTPRVGSGQSATAVLLYRKNVRKVIANLPKSVCNFDVFMYG